MYSTAPAEWASGHSLVVRVLPLSREAVYSTAPAEWASGHSLLVRVLPLCREAVSVFYSSSWMGHSTLLGGILLLCRDAVSVFYNSSGLSHRTLNGGEGLTPLQRSSQCILQPQPTGQALLLDQWLLNHQDPVLVPYGSPAIVSRWPRWAGGLPICRGAVSVFYSPGWLGKSNVE